MRHEEMVKLGEIKASPKSPYATYEYYYDPRNCRVVRVAVPRPPRPMEPVVSILTVDEAMKYLPDQIIKVLTKLTSACPSRSEACSSERATP